MNRVVKTCLAKDPEDRFQTAHDVKLQLEWVQEGGSEAGLPAPVVARRKNREKVAWAAAAVLGVAFGALFLGATIPYLSAWAAHCPRPGALTALARLSGA